MHFTPLGVESVGFCAMGSELATDDVPSTGRTDGQIMDRGTASASAAAAGAASDLVSALN